MGWISVKDQLPSGGSNVIVHKHNGLVCEMRFNVNNEFHWRQGNGKWLDQTSQILHWMPLPEPPKT